MKINLFSFQQNAMTKMRKQAYQALSTYNIDTDRPPQIISFTAPTGAGKTIIMSALLENIFFGDEILPARPDSIVVWLSDDPQLNEQSKEKLETRADKFVPGQCVTISEDSFDSELLEDGKVYFLNTQKLTRSAKLTKHSDSRQYTIWETFQNTIIEKSDRLYFVIDEAHRGAKPSESGTATSIMQKFILGDPDLSLSPMPLVIGMSATVKRFNALAEGSSSSIHKTIVSPDEVRRSGLLKDRIEICYPDEQLANKDMAILQAATDEWINKRNRWFQYCQEQHYAHVYPIMLVQVENGTAGRVSNTDLADCIDKIEQRIGRTFDDGELVHAFGSKSDLEINGRLIRYVEPSSISGNRKIQVVLFKDTLSTGWDCPRAETMMSFRNASDSTYIAQLLGRMVRTPMQMRIEKDETLNDVKLFVPHFNRLTVKQVVDELQNIEGGELPTDISGQQVGNSTIQNLTIHRTTPVTSPCQPTIISTTAHQTSQYTQGNRTTTNPIITQTDSSHHIIGSVNTSHSTVQTPSVTISQNSSNNSDTAQLPNSTVDSAQDNTVISFDRVPVIDAINELALLSYSVRLVRVSDFFHSFFAISRLLQQSGEKTDARTSAVKEIVDNISTYIENLKTSGEYDNLVKKVQEFKMSSQIFDALGTSIDNYTSHNLFSTTDTDIERQFNLAEVILGREGIGIAYCNEGSIEEVTQRKIDVILFTSDANAIERMQEHCKLKFYNLKDNYRLAFANKEEKWRKRYDEIVIDGDPISQKSFHLPENISITADSDGEVFSDHLFVDNATGTAKFKLTSWESKLLKQERLRPDFVTWLRNPSRKPWALCIPYIMNNDSKAMYPDFVIVRKVGSNYVLDVLEPHNSSLKDNLPKAKGLADYALREPKIGRVQLIRLVTSHGVEKLVRLDLNNSLVRDKVVHATSEEELDHIFDIYGITD